MVETSLVQFHVEVCEPAMETSFVATLTARPPAPPAPAWFVNGLFTLVGAVSAENELTRNVWFSVVVYVSDPVVAATVWFVADPAPSTTPFSPATSNIPTWNRVVNPPAHVIVYVVNDDVIDGSHHRNTHPAEADPVPQSWAKFWAPAATLAIVRVFVTHPIAQT